MAKAKPKITLRQELPPGTPHVLSVLQACEALSIRETKLYQLMGAGELRGYKLGDRLVIRPADVAKLIASLPEAKITTKWREPRKRRLG